MALNSVKMSVFDCIFQALMEDHKYACVMCPAPAKLAEAVRQWGKMFVTEDELYADPDEPDEKGREDEIHVTAKYGLHEASPTVELLKIIEETQPFEIEIGPCTLFENDKFDVVKFDVESAELRELNQRLSELPNTDTHSEFHPHMTIAYITKGCCHDLIGKPLLDTDVADDLRFVVRSVIFSGPSDFKVELFLGKPNLEEALGADDDEDLDIEMAKEVGQGRKIWVN